jgi:hypothetical protein
MIDLAGAVRFVQLHGRLLDRRRLALLTGNGPAAAVESAVNSYANHDGGFAGLIEPDVRTISSQPIGVLTALETLHEAGRPAPLRALDWLRSISNPDGGVPFHLRATDQAPEAPWMAASESSSLHMTAALAAVATRLDAKHPWLADATAYCLCEIDAADSLSAYEMRYALGLLEAVDDVDRLHRLGSWLPPSGRLAVEGGTPGETLSPLVLSPDPAGLVRGLLPEEAIEVALEDLERGQHEDGGWDFDWLAWSPVVAFEWRARVTVEALHTLSRHGRALDLGQAPSHE